MKRSAALLYSALALALGAYAAPSLGACDLVSRDELARAVLLQDGECRIFPMRGYRYLTLILSPDTAATATLTVGAAPADGEAVVLGAKTYTYESGTLDADGEVDVGATADVSLANLVAAANLSGVAGTAYATAMTAGDATAGALSLDAAATGTLTGTTIADTNTVTIGSTTYTYEASLTEADCHVLLGASDSDSLDNLIAAINGGAGAGTLYASACTARTDATAAAGAGDTMTLTYDTNGVNGNALATTATLGAGGWGAVTLEGGESSILFTARIAGTDGNSLDSTTTLSDGAFVGATFDDDGTDSTATYSRVNNSGASAHGDVTATFTDGAPAASAVTVDWPFYMVSTAGGSLLVGAVP